MSWDVAVAGGGLAGAAAATRLALAGRQVVLFERERGPHDKVCGEFLSHDAVADLAGLDLDVSRLGAAPIERVRLISGRTEAAADLPFAAWGLSRRRLDGELLDRAARQGVQIRRGVRIRGLMAEGAGVRLSTSDANGNAAAALLATGKHDLRGWRRGDPSRLLGLKMHLRLGASQLRALRGHVELSLFDGGYAGLQPIEDGIANLCLVIARRRFAALGRDWRALVAAVPHLAVRLDGAAALHAQPLAVAGMPYGWRADPTVSGPVYRVGDQAAVIPSFSGDGMAMALYSGRLAAEAILADRSPAAYQRAVASTFRRPLRLAGLVVAVGTVSWLQPVLTAVCRLAPSLMSNIAAQTRIPVAA